MMLSLIVGALAGCSYIAFKGRTFSSKEEEQAVSRELLNWGTHHEFLCALCTCWVLAALPVNAPTHVAPNRAVSAPRCRMKAL